MSFDASRVSKKGKAKSDIIIGIRKGWNKEEDESNTIALPEEKGGVVYLWIIIKKKVKMNIYYNIIIYNIGKGCKRKFKKIEQNVEKNF